MRFPPHAIGPPQFMSLDRVSNNALSLRAGHVNSVQKLDPSAHAPSTADELPDLYRFILSGHEVSSLQRLCLWNQRNDENAPRSQAHANRVAFHHVDTFYSEADKCAKLISRTRRWGGRALFSCLHPWVCERTQDWAVKVKLHVVHY